MNKTREFKNNFVLFKSYFKSSWDSQILCRFVVVLAVVGVGQFLLDDNRRGTSRLLVTIATVASDAISCVVMDIVVLFVEHLHCTMGRWDINSFGSRLLEDLVDCHVIMLLWLAGLCLRFFRRLGSLQN